MSPVCLARGETVEARPAKVRDRQAVEFPNRLGHLAVVLLAQHAAVLARHTH
jgi:hypothetical protein